MSRGKKVYWESELQIKNTVPVLLGMKCLLHVEDEHYYLRREIPYTKTKSQMQIKTNSLIGFLFTGSTHISDGG